MNLNFTEKENNTGFKSVPSLRIDLSQVEDIEIDGINPLDYPDFCDAFIIDATYRGRQMTHDELEALNEDSDFVYEKVMEELY